MGWLDDLRSFWTEDPPEAPFRILAATPRGHNVLIPRVEAEYGDVTFECVLCLHESSNPAYCPVCKKFQPEVRGRGYAANPFVHLMGSALQ